MRRLRGALPQGSFFSASSLPAADAAAVSSWTSSALLFGRWPIWIGNDPPDWLANPLTGQRIPHPERHWWEIPDFDPVVGDIKLIWEFSRMDWVIAFAQRARQGEAEALNKLNAWLADWCRSNPPYLGPNWKCGQEASIRVMHLACAAIILGQTRDSLPALRHLIALHLQRIEPTLQYAMAQDNNHGTSEAAALFIGGSWLDAHGHARGATWAGKGRRWLENRAARLIGEQGTFSQYSLNYHRVMLDTFSLAECWRRHLGLEAFSDRWKSRALAATQWLHALTDPISGDGPNVGANDGARLLQLVDTPYRDYRPSIQLGMALFANQRAYPEAGAWNDALQWLGVQTPTQVAEAAGTMQADDGGFLVLRQGGAMVLLRYPRFRFRPSQADVLHTDLWLDGQPLLRDAGTYSYNTDAQWLEYFGGTQGHNTVQFDSREQMPRISRFLLGDWLRTEGFEAPASDESRASAAAGYCDRAGARHHRRLTLSDSMLAIDDQVSGFWQAAVLRWRLAPGDWTQDPVMHHAQGSHVLLRNSHGHTVKVTSSTSFRRCALVQGWESLHYLEKKPTPVLEVEICEPGQLTTEYQWAQ
ncbi:heparinase II/III-family protein [Piscinibacterium candidicorallinum]|uniref:Heparinase II/III-family protein n=1 Tax=Piscinibacterium candidicorallinum TaxID=1793872 RepID=A0ABV7HBJ8_9BURK